MLEENPLQAGFDGVRPATSTPAASSLGPPPLDVLLSASDIPFFSVAPIEKGCFIGPVTAPHKLLARHRTVER